MRRVLFGFLYAIPAYLLSAFGGGYAMTLLSSNQHDRSVEAAMTGAFVLGPLAAIIGFVIGVIRGSSAAREASASHMADRLERNRAAFVRATKSAGRAGARSAVSLNLAEASGDESNQFALAIYSEIRQSPGNIFFSPLSIRAALGMVYAGANTETAEQMRTVLRFPSATGHEALGKAIERLH